MPQKRNGEISTKWTEYKSKPTKEAGANFRLKTGHDCLAEKMAYMNLVTAQFVKCQTPRWMRNICYTLYLYSANMMTIIHSIFKGWHAQPTTRSMAGS